ncbi:MAG: TetR/AcrR family transcriptional regulator [Thermodesulfobacteriota bacterium]
MEASATFQNIPPGKQRRVLDEARGEFAEHGFAGASMNRLSARLGIAKGSLFKYFGSKDGLFARVFDGAVEHFAGFLRQARDETAGRPLAERLERLFAVGTDFVRAHPDIYRIYLKMLAGGDFPLREKFLAQVRSLSSRFLTPIIEQAKASGELPASLDTKLAVFVLDCVLDRFVQSQAVPWMDTGLHISLDDPEPARLAAKRLAAMLAGGFKAGGLPVG